MLFVAYSLVKDEAMHVALSLIVAGVGYALNAYGFAFFVVCFLAGITIDVDHLLNSAIAKRMRLPIDASMVRYGSNGYTIKILHGFDVAFIAAGVVFLITRNFHFAFFLGMNLCIHELWNFIVYPHSWRELFLTTRWRARFRPGMREKATGFIFALSTLKF